MVAIIYLIQIVFLLLCIGMTWRARRALNGMSRGLILLCVLLIVRRLDDMLGYLDSVGTLVLSSSVVIIVTYDIWIMYRQREIYAFYLKNRQARIAALEAQREQSEKTGMDWEHQRTFKM